jgi:hypothetical protein
MGNDNEAKKDVTDLTNDELERLLWEATQGHDTPWSTAVLTRERTRRGI